MKTNLIKVAGLIALTIAISFSVALLTKTATTYVTNSGQTINGIDGRDGQNGKDSTLGSSGGSYSSLLDTQAGVGYNGAVLDGKGVQFQNSTTTVCNILTPAATSSFASGFINITRNATTTVRTLIIATSTVDYATTSPFWEQSIAANGTPAFSIAPATSTAALTTAYGVLPPNTRIVVSFKGAGIGATTDELDGTCNFMWLRARIQ